MPQHFSQKLSANGVFSKSSTAEPLLSRHDALALATVTDTPSLTIRAQNLRDRGFRNLITYSRKVFIPLTPLCRNVCHYCTFARSPRQLSTPYLLIDEILETVRQGAAHGCKEVLFTLGERPEDRYPAARNALAKLGFESTLDYLSHVAGVVLKETGLLPHINAGCMSLAEIKQLRSVSASMGMMLESASSRLGERGMPHHGSPDKDPQRRLETIRLAGQQQVPFTSGILIGIGENRKERIEALLALRQLHLEHGHIQEIIIQNFRAKPGTRMATAPEPDLNELLWSIAVARLIFGPQMSIQAPPNLSPGLLPQLINAGINDWGGVSPLTPDYVNPEAPWPHLNKLAHQTELAGKHLQERLAIYPKYAIESSTWLDPALQTTVIRMVDTEGYPRTDLWVAGQNIAPARTEIDCIEGKINEQQVSPELRAIVAWVKEGKTLTEQKVERLFQARGPELGYLCQQADSLRQQRCGDSVTYVVNRNINYTNVCYFKCQFCAFAKGKTSENLRGRPYDLSKEEISRRTQEAWERGSNEVCMQGGIHPDYNGQTYLDLLKTVGSTTPKMHIHAFSPLEVWQGAKTLGISIKAFLVQLNSEGLQSLPGTAAEILDDEVRAIICQDKISTTQWLEVVKTAHQVGLKTTATIMFGHVEQLQHWARHLLKIRDLQTHTGGFTELVPLPFVPMTSPLYLKGRARKGPTFRETLLMHAVSRLVLYRKIDNIQTSWVKLGDQGASLTLKAGANDLGGTLMNESITQAAGADHGQEKTPQEMDSLIRSINRIPKHRSTLYGEISPERINAAYQAVELAAIINTPLARKR